MSNVINIHKYISIFVFQHPWLEKARYDVYRVKVFKSFTCIYLFRISVCHIFSVIFLIQKYWVTLSFVFSSCTLLTILYGHNGDLPVSHDLLWANKECENSIWTFWMIRNRVSNVSALLDWAILHHYMVLHITLLYLSIILLSECNIDYMRNCACRLIYFLLSWLL